MMTIVIITMTTISGDDLTLTPKSGKVSPNKAKKTSKQTTKVKIKGGIENVYKVDFPLELE